MRSDREGSEGESPRGTRMTGVDNLDAPDLAEEWPVEEKEGMVGDDVDSGARTEGRCEVFRMTDTDDQHFSTQRNQNQAHPPSRYPGAYRQPHLLPILADSSLSRSTLDPSRSAAPYFPADPDFETGDPARWRYLVDGAASVRLPRSAIQTPSQPLQELRPTDCSTSGTSCRTAEGQRSSPTPRSCSTADEARPRTSLIWFVCLTPFLAPD